MQIGILSYYNLHNYVEYCLELAPSGTSLLEEQVTQYGVTEYGLSTCAFRSEADDHCLGC